MAEDDRPRGGNAPWIKEPSSKGIFAQTASHGLSLRSRNRIANSKRMDEFADLLAEGLTPSQAARRMGFLPSYGNAMLQRIRQRLGPQAV